MKDGTGRTRSDRDWRCRARRDRTRRWGYTRRHVGNAGMQSRGRWSGTSQITTFSFRDQTAGISSRSRRFDRRIEPSESAFYSFKWLSHDHCSPRTKKNLKARNGIKSVRASQLRYRPAARRDSTQTIAQFTETHLLPYNVHPASAQCGFSLTQCRSSSTCSHTIADQERP